MSSHMVGEYDVISVDTARGKRRHSGIIEELIEQDSVKINEKVIPVMNIGRRNLKGKFVETEPHAQKSICYYCRVPRYLRL